MHDLWWTKWHCDRFFSKFFGLPCQSHSTIALHTHISPEGMHNRPNGGSNSKTLSHPIDMNNNIAVANPEDSILLMPKLAIR
jgi:hypothetical protein